MSETERTKTEEAIIWFKCQNKLSKCENDPTPLPNHIVKIMEYHSLAISALKKNERISELCKKVFRETTSGDFELGIKAMTYDVTEILEEVE